MIADASAPRRTRLLGLVLLVVTFLVGAFSGAAVDRRWVLAQPAPAAAAEPAPPGGAAPASAPRSRDADIFDHLELSAEQRVRIDSILEAGKVKVDAFWKEEGSHLRAVVDTTRSEVRALMTPAQREAYDRLRAERRARRNSCEHAAEPKETKTR
jgi:Spy/CpxP family protein refolding chaperone